MTTDFFETSRTLDATRRRERLTFRGNARQGRHGWLRLTPAYSLHIVRRILENHAPDALVLDPFSGSGTTAVASVALGFNAHAVEINPFLVWLGNAKLRRYDHLAASTLLAEAAEIAARTREHVGRRAWVPEMHQIDKWWDPDVLTALSVLWESITACPTSGENADLFKIAFCRAAIETSHASFGHQSMSFKNRDRGAQATLFDVSCSDDPVVFRRFMVAVAEVAASLSTDVPIAEARVFLGDARHLDRLLPVSHYDIVITSPPYPNRMSYIREMRPYMYWLGFLTSGRQAGELDWAAIGGTWGCATSNLGKWMPDETLQIPYPGFREIVDRISQVHPLLGRYVHKYFEDIKVHLHSLRRVVSPGAACYYIVGNSKFYDTVVPVEEICAALLEATGFSEARIEPLRKRNSKKELYEFIVQARLSLDAACYPLPTTSAAASALAEITR